MTQFSEIDSTPLVVRVLVVEDSPSDALLAVSVLDDATLHRFHPIVVPTIREALPLLDDVDVVLLDLDLPDAQHLDGLERIREARPELPVIVLTGALPGPTTEAALSLGAQDYLPKDGLTGFALDRAIAYARARQGLVVRLEASERWAKALVHSVSDIISIHGPDGELQHLGGRGALALSWSDPPRVEDLRPHVDRATWLGMLRAFRRWRRIGFGSFELTVRLDDGTVRHLESVATDMLDDPSIRGIVVTTRDVTDRHLIADRLTHEATHDALTGLPNRTLFHDRVRSALARQRREHTSVALLMVDLDNFKNINDSYGHPAGDDVLRAVSSLLTVGLRSEDTLARLGGDEFAVVCPDVTPQTAERVARRLQRALARPFSAGGHEVHQTASIGIAISDEDHSVGATELLRNADLALYQSKSSGRGCVSVFDERLEKRALRRMEIETELRGALVRQELFMVYQPVIHLQTGRVRAHEALLRWTHPRLGEIPPDEFVPVAEDCGLIVPLGRWVLERACMHLAAWRRSDPSEDLRVAVNVSARQLVEPGFVPELLDVLQRTDVPATALTLEVTETALIEEFADSSEALRRLRTLGVRVALDDFGTGYSSLTYLKRLPVDVLKIDKSFIEDVGHSVHDQAVVGGVTRMAHALGLDVIAEGVEDEDQRDELRLLGCDKAQGYLFSRPITHEAVLESMQKVYETGSGPDGTDADRSQADVATTIVASLADTGALERGSLQLERLHGSEAQHRRAHTGGPEDVWSDDPDAGAILHRWTRELLRARTPERVVSISIGLVRSLGGTVVPDTIADPTALPLDLAMGHGPRLLPCAPPLTVARLRLEGLLPCFVEDACHAMQACRGVTGNRELDPETGVLARWPLARSLESAAQGRAVLVVRAPQEVDGMRTIARLLRSVTDPDDTIGVWDDELLVVVRSDACDGGEQLVDDIDDQWSRWGGTDGLELALVRTDGTWRGEDLIRAGAERLSTAR